jgi:hypothetical protein
MAESRVQRWTWWIVALMLALTIGAIWAWERLYDAYGAADDVDAALVYRTGDGAQVVILDRVSHTSRFDTDYTWRLNLWAPGEDAPRLRKRVPGTRLLAVGARLLWFHSPQHGVHARDPATFEVRVDEAQLRQKNPELAVGLMPPDSFEAWKVNSGVDPASGRVIVTAKDGRRFAIDPESFAATAYTGEDMRTVLNFEGACAGAAKAPELELEIRGEGPRKQVRRGERTVGEFVTPERLAACSVEATPTAVALLLHRAVLDEAAPSQLTAVSATGEALWTTALTGESGWGWVRVLFASLSADEVLLVVQGEYGRFSRMKSGLLTIDRETGRIRSAPAV